METHDPVSTRKVTEVIGKVDYWKFAVKVERHKESLGLAVLTGDCVSFLRKYNLVNNDYLK